MDIAAILRTLLRRWLVVLIGVVLSAGATYQVFRMVPLSYQVTSQAIVLLPRTAASMEYETNPFLYLPTGLSVLTRVVTASSDTARFRAEMQRDGFQAQYEVDSEPREPIVRFSVEGQDPVMVGNTHRELLRRFEAELARLQAREGTPERQLAIVRFLAADAQPIAVSGDRFRAAAMTAAVGLGLTLLIAFLIERRAARGRPRREASVLNGSPAERKVPHSRATAANERLQGETIPDPVAASSEYDGDDGKPGA